MRFINRIKTLLFPGSELKQHTKVLREIRIDLKLSNRLALSLLRAETSELIDDVVDWHDKYQLDELTTLQTIADERISFARYGDGEIRMMLSRTTSFGFQTNSVELQNALREVIEHAKQSPDEILIGLNAPLQTEFWLGVYAFTWRQTKQDLQGLERVGSTSISRDLVFRQYPDSSVRYWRNIWDGLDVTFVTGEGSRFELEPNLFDNLARYKMVHSKPVNAFEDLDRLIEVLSDDDSELTLIALGPTGTVLASRLAKLGKWALDIGHLPNTYQEVFKGGKRPEMLPRIKSDLT